MLPQFDYLFYLDGTIEVRLSASGYMQGGYWSPEQEGYGARIHDTSSKHSIRYVVFWIVNLYIHITVGNLHDHVINFKYVNLNPCPFRTPKMFLKIDVDCILCAL